MSDTINITGLDKAKLLAALYNASKGQGMGAMNPASKRPMQIEEAEVIVKNHLDEKLPLDFDYVHGRIMKVNISGDALDPSLYDRDVGAGAAAAVVEALRRDGAT